ncbi:MAG: hypothetical protein ACRC0V_04250 [Fusobacteriaceae bacterium]
MENKILKYNMDKINLEDFGTIDLQAFISELKEKNVEIAGIIPLEDGEEFANFILKDLKLDLYWDIVYPEGLSSLISVENKELVMGDYKYLVAFKEKEKKEYVYWFSAYKNLENISKELKLIED